MPAPQDHTLAVRRALNERGTASSPELQQQLGLSQSTVSRAIRQLRGEVLSFGAGRARRYAMARAVPRVGSTVGVFSISPLGQPAAEGSLQAIAGGKYWLEPARGNGQVFDSLPWFALDQRPEGFLGRALARAHQGEGLPSRLSDWNDDQILYALTAFGGSSRGDLVFGDRMLAGAQSAPRAIVVDQANREERYPQLAG